MNSENKYNNGTNNNNNLFTKQIPSHVLLQTGTNQWQQHDKENALVELFF